MHLCTCYASFVHSLGNSVDKNLRQKRLLSLIKAKPFATQTELRLVFKHPPALHFLGDRRHRPPPNQLVFKIDPATGIRLTVDAQRADARGPAEIELDMEFAQEGGEGATPYEVLLHAAMIGDSTHFTRQDGVEECWRVVQPLLDSPPSVHPYEKDTWGPPEADRLLSGFGGWRGPWIESDRRPG